MKIKTNSINQINKYHQILIKTPTGLIPFQNIKWGYFMKLAKYKGKSNRIFCCKYIYYSQANFPKKIRLRLSDITKWTDSSTRNVMQKILKLSNLGYTYAKLRKITNSIKFYKTARNLITSFEFFNNVPGLVERMIEFMNFITILSHKDFPKMMRPIDSKLMKIGWPPSMRLTFQEMIELTANDTPLTKIQIEKYLLKRFNNETFSEMQKNWEELSLFAKRINILKDAMSAHNAGQYSLSVPVLLAQAEGIIASLGNIKGRKSHRDIVDIANEMSKSVILHESFIHTLTNSFLEEFKFGHDEFFNLGRNSILHGVNLEYATPENSLKSILLIDFLFEITKFIFKKHRS